MQTAQGDDHASVLAHTDCRLDSGAGNDGVLAKQQFQRDVVGRRIRRPRRISAGFERPHVGF